MQIHTTASITNTHKCGGNVEGSESALRAIGSTPEGDPCTPAQCRPLGGGTEHATQFETEKTIYASAKSRRDAARKRARRHANSRWVRRIKVWWFFVRTGQWVLPSELEWHHLDGRKRLNTKIAKLYSRSRRRIRAELRLCIPMLKEEHASIHNWEPW